MNKGKESSAGASGRGFVVMRCGEEPDSVQSQDVHAKVSSRVPADNLTVWGAAQLDRTGHCHPFLASAVRHEARRVTWLERSSTDQVVHALQSPFHEAIESSGQATHEEDKLPWKLRCCFLACHEKNVD